MLCNQSREPPAQIRAGQKFPGEMLLEDKTDKMYNRYFQKDAQENPLMMVASGEQNWRVQSGEGKTFFPIYFLYC